jgi:hypothetical protein
VRVRRLFGAAFIAAKTSAEQRAFVLAYYGTLCQVGRCAAEYLGPCTILVSTTAHCARSVPQLSTRSLYHTREYYGTLCQVGQ